MSLPLDPVEPAIRSLARTEARMRDSPSTCPSGKTGKAVGGLSLSTYDGIRDPAESIGPVHQVIFDDPEAVHYHLVGGPEIDEAGHFVDTRVSKTTQLLPAVLDRPYQACITHHSFDGIVDDELLVVTGQASQVPGLSLQFGVGLQILRVRGLSNPIQVLLFTHQCVDQE